MGSAGPAQALLPSFVRSSCSCCLCTYYVPGTVQTIRGRSSDRAEEAQAGETE